MLEGKSTGFLGILFVKWLRELTLYTFIHLLQCLLQYHSLNLLVTQICCRHQHVRNKHKQGLKSMSMLTRYRLIAAESSRSILQSGDINCSNEMSLQWNRSRTSGLLSILQNVFIWMVMTKAWFSDISHAVHHTRSVHWTLNLCLESRFPILFITYSVNNWRLQHTCYKQANIIWNVWFSILSSKVWAQFFLIIIWRTSHTFTYMLCTVQSLTKCFSKKTWWK